MFGLLTTRGNIGVKRDYLCARVTDLLLVQLWHDGPQIKHQSISVHSIKQLKQITFERQLFNTENSFNALSVKGVNKVLEKLWWMTYN